MSERRARVGSRAVETALWAAVVLAGGYLLMPAAVELIQTREQEAVETARADAAEEDVRTAQHQLNRFSADPLAAEKVREQHLVDARTVDVPSVDD